MLWVVWEQWVFLLNDILYRFWNSKTNDSKKENYDQALIQLVAASLVLQITISLQVFLDVSSLYTHYMAFLPQMRALLDILVKITWSGIRSDLKRPKWYYVEFMGKKIAITGIQLEHMSTKHEMLCGQRISNSSNKINKMIKVGISIKSIPTCFLPTLKIVAIWFQFLSWSRKNCTTLSLNYSVNKRLVFIFSAIFCKFYLIIVYDLKAKCTINSKWIFMFDLKIVY